VFLIISIICEILEYDLTGKDNLAIDFARNSPTNTRLVDINNEFLLQHHMRCLLEAHPYLEDVVIIINFIIN
jgi:hypothetical protein